MNDCTRAREWISGFVDGDLTGEQSEWLGGHVGSCPECRTALAEFAAIDNELTGWGRQLVLDNPAAPGTREQLALRLGSHLTRKQKIRWMPVAAAAALAAMVVAAVVTMMAPHKATPPAARVEQPQFIGIPYLPPLDPRENTAIVRTNIRVATLIAAGYRVAADPNAIVSADVLVGEDGRAHAVRMLSDIHLN